MEQGKQTKQAVEHRVRLEDRKAAYFTGVHDVRAFDEKEIMLETELGMLLVRGTNLQVKRLSLESGEVEVEGEIDGMLYSQKTGRKKSGESAIKRLFG